MDRRRFLQLASLSGLALAGAPGFVRADDPDASGGEDDYTGPLFVTVQANGGWDPTLLCDPKPDLNRSYGEGDVGTAGAILYAPVPGAKAFFEAHHGRMTVLNGIDTGTNAHDAGQRNSASGRLGEGYPCLAAMVAGHGAPQRPMSFISFGNYDRSFGLVAPTRNGNHQRLAELSFPDRISAADPASATYLGEAGHALVGIARRARAERQLAHERLPRLRHALDSMMTARTGSAQLQRLQEVLPAPDPTELYRQAQLVVAAYKAGVGVAGNLFLPGFDTHDDHDNRHRAKMAELLGLLTFLWDEADRQGVADRMVVLVCSEFGRTPAYNANDGGKDHWPVTSMIAMGAGIPGDRVVGRSDSGHNAMRIDPLTHAASDQGVVLTSAHVHRGLRRVLGLTDTEVDAAFPIAIDDALDPFA